MHLYKSSFSKTLAESRRYVAGHEYETAFLFDKRLQCETVVGHFYGDPYIAVISPDERFVVFAGEGIIVQYTQENRQLVWGRDDGTARFVEAVQLIGGDILAFTLEDGSTHTLRI